MRCYCVGVYNGVFGGPDGEGGGAKKNLARLGMGGDRSKGAS